MNNDIVCDRDKVVLVKGSFGPRKLRIIGPHIIHGSGHFKIKNRKVCILGDEKKFRAFATYTTPSHPNPGMGVLTIKHLNSSQKSKHLSSHKKLILKGNQFTMSFKPTVPATSLALPPVPDLIIPSCGRGKFSTHQRFVKAN